MSRIRELTNPFLGKRETVEGPPARLPAGTFLVVWTETERPEFETGRLDTIPPADPEMPYFRELLASVVRSATDPFSERTATLLRMTRILPRATAPGSPVVFAGDDGFVVSSDARLCVCVADRGDFVLDDPGFLADREFGNPETGVLVSREPDALMVLGPVPAACLSRVLAMHASTAVLVPPSMPEVSLLVRVCDRSVRRVEAPAVFELAIRLPAVLGDLTYRSGAR